MRVGQNPAKGLREVAHPAEITAAVTVYIPFLSGYYEQSLEVLKLSLESLRTNADLPFDLMVFDNGSCAEVRAYLQEMQHQGKIQYLILSEHNMGVVGAWNVLFGAAPGKYIAYSDYDIFFYPNWLSSLMGVLEAFPQAGMVTGLPLLSPAEFSSSTLAWAEQTAAAVLESGQLISWDDFWRHSRSISPSQEEGEKFYAEHQAHRISHDGKQCFVGAGHFQFIGRKEYFEKITPLYAERPMGGEVRNLDKAIDAAGYLRLCTPAWHVEHMGNSVQERFKMASINAAEPNELPHQGSRLVKIGIVRRILESVYNRIFKILHEG